MSRSIKFRAKIAYLWQEYKFLLVAFIIPLLLQWMIFIAMEVYPFGNSSVLVLDLNGQYIYFFEDLRNKVLSGGSFLYTWTRSLGGEFMGIYAYYLASPFSFLVSLFPSEHMTEALLIIELLKTGMMGFTMALYLNQAKKSAKFNTIIFSTCYALSAYAVVYGHNTMWIDCVILLPLVSLGIEQLIKKGEFKLYVPCLALCLLTSFYIGYMVCLYVIIYFFYYYLAHSSHSENNFWLEENHFWKSLGRIAWFSFIAVCIAMIIIYPAYTSLQFGKSTFSTTKWTFAQRFDLMDFFVKLFPGSYDTVRPEGLPVIYCGVLAVLLVPVYFICSKIRWQERIMGGIVLAFFIICFDTNAVDIFWHGFQKPNWLNYRYSFMFIFLMLVFAYKAFTELPNIQYRNVMYVSGAFVILLMLIQKQDYEFAGDWSCIALSVFAIAVYAATLYLVHAGKMRGMAACLIAVICCVELFASGMLNITALDSDVVISSRTSYNSYMEKVRPSVEWIKNYDTSEFYRMEKNFHRKTNDPMTLGFYGISNSTSTLNKSVIKTLHSYGYASKSHWTKYLGGTPVSDSLINMKYIISNAETDNQVWELVHTDEDYNYYTYYNPYILSLAYAANAGLADLELSEYASCFEALNAVVSAACGRDVRIFTPLEVTNTDYSNITTGFTTQHRKYSKKDDAASARITYTVEAPAGMPVYLNFPTDYPREANLKVNGTSKGTAMGNETDRAIFLGTFDEEQTVTVVLELKDDPLYIKTNQDYFYSFDSELFKEVFSELQKGNMNITHFDDTHIEGTVNVPEGCSLLATSIAFDEGWEVYVDGQRADLVKIEDSLLAVSITEGEHEVKMKYLPKCYTVGGAISLAGIGLFVLCIIGDEIRKRIALRRWAEENCIF